MKTKNEKMIYFISSGDGLSHQYEFEAIGKKEIKMKYFAGDSGWTSKVSGKSAINLKDSGDDLTLKFGVNAGKTLKLDYSQAEQLMYMLNFLNEDASFQKFISKAQKFKEVE